MLAQAINGDWNPHASLPDTFFNISSKVYEKDNQWIPENSKSIAQQFSSDNPYFENNEVWIGTVTGQARLAGFFDASNKIGGEPVCYFGFWESLNNLAANQQLFSELETWAKQKGAKKIYGPINFTTYQSNRIKLDDFNEPSFQGEPRTPEYYPELLNSLGYDIFYRYFTNITHDIPTLAQSLKPAYEKFLASNDYDLTIETLTPDIWMDNLPYLYGFIDQVFGENFGYRKITEQQFYGFCGESFAKKMCPYSSMVARNSKGDIKGFFMAYPNYSELLNQDSNQNIKENQISFDAHFSKLSSPKTVIGKTAAVAPDCRGAHLFSAMSYVMTLNASQHYKTFYGAMVREDNPSAIVSGRLPESRSYGLFSKTISNDSFTSKEFR